MSGNNNHRFYVVASSADCTYHTRTLCNDSRNINSADLRQINAIMLEQAQDYRRTIQDVFITSIIYLGEMTDDEWLKDDYADHTLTT